jgi:ADP-ribose pyrophosphatase YjhB (NUDIX family)
MDDRFLLYTSSWRWNKMVEKVLAYIIRYQQGHYQLLVHTHQYIPQAGIQVPGGTVDFGEDLTTALHREIEEESGLQLLSSEQLITSKPYLHPEKQELQLRHFFLLETVQQLPGAWNHRVVGNGLDCGLVFCYTWYDLHAVPSLAASQDEALPFIKNFLT